MAYICIPGFYTLNLIEDPIYTCSMITLILTLPFYFPILLSLHLSIHRRYTSTHLLSTYLHPAPPCPYPRELQLFTLSIFTPRHTPNTPSLIPLHLSVSTALQVCFPLTPHLHLTPVHPFSQESMVHALPSTLLHSHLLASLYMSSNPFPYLHP